MLPVRFARKRTYFPQAVLTKKADGNVKFKAGSFGDAVATYNDALKDLKVLQDDGKVQGAWARKATCPFWCAYCSSCV